MIDPFTNHEPRKLRLLAKAIVGLLVVMGCETATVKEDPAKPSSSSPSEAEEDESPPPNYGDVPPLGGEDDPLPPMALARFGSARFRHYSPFLAMTFSADGKMLVTQEWDLGSLPIRFLRLDGREVATLRLEDEGY